MCSVAILARARPKHHVYGDSGTVDCGSPGHRRRAVGGRLACMTTRLSFACGNEVMAPSGERPTGNPQVGPSSTCSWRYPLTHRPALLLGRDPRPCGARNATDLAVYVTLHLSKDVRALPQLFSAMQEVCIELQHQCFDGQEVDMAIGAVAGGVITPAMLRRCGHTIPKRSPNMAASTSGADDKLHLPAARLACRYKKRHDSTQKV